MIVSIICGSSFEQIVLQNYTMTNLLLSVVVVSSVLGSALAFAGEYVPKSYYVIDREGHQSDVVYLRYRRAADLFPSRRLKRGGGNGGGSSSFSSASASASSSSSSGSGGGGPIYFGGQDSFPNQGYSNIDPNTYNQGSSGHHPGDHRAFTGGSSSSDSGNPKTNFRVFNNDAGPTLFSRFGEDTGSNINVEGTASGQKGAFSSSSSSVDSDGKIKYSIQSGKY